MKREDLYRAIGEVSEELLLRCEADGADNELRSLSSDEIEKTEEVNSSEESAQEAASSEKKKGRLILLRRFVTAAAACLVVGFVSFGALYGWPKKSAILPSQSSSLASVVQNATTAAEIGLGVPGQKADSPQQAEEKPQASAPLPNAMNDAPGSQPVEEAANMGTPDMAMNEAAMDMAQPEMAMGDEAAMERPEAFMDDSANLDSSGAGNMGGGLFDWKSWLSAGNSGDSSAEAAAQSARDENSYAFSDLPREEELADAEMAEDAWADADMMAEDMGENTGMVEDAWADADMIEEEAGAEMLPAETAPEASAEKEALPAETALEASAEKEELLTETVPETSTEKEALPAENARETSSQAQKASFFDSLEKSEVSSSTASEALSQVDTLLAELPADKAARLAEAEAPVFALMPDEKEYIQKNGTMSEKFWELLDAWSEQRSQNRIEAQKYSEDLMSFCKKTLPVYLAGEEGENKVYSPLNAWMAISMLAEVTDGETRAQILDLLGVSDMENLRLCAAALWNGNNIDDGSMKSSLANSFWLANDMDYRDETLGTLASSFHASSFSGQMGSAEYDRLLAAWLSDQTEGMLAEEAGQIKLDPETVLALASTLTFRADWSQEFDPQATYDAVFHGEKEDETCRMMDSLRSGSYYYGDGFSAVGLSLLNSGTMWFILPDEEVSCEDLLKQDNWQNLILGNSDSEDFDSVYRMIHIGLPKFDITSQMDLCDGLKELGLIDVFDPEKSDFTPLTLSRDDIFLAMAEHDARVTVDEEGVSAAAFTVMAMAGAGMPPQEIVEFILDRPFLFAITSDSGALLFAGTVKTVSP